MSRDIPKGTRLYPLQGIFIRKHTIIGVSYRDTITCKTRYKNIGRNVSEAVDIIINEYKLITGKLINEINASTLDKFKRKYSNYDLSNEVVNVYYSLIGQLKEKVNELDINVINNNSNNNINNANMNGNNNKINKLKENIKKKNGRIRKLNKQNNKLKKSKEKLKVSSIKLKKYNNVSNKPENIKRRNLRKAAKISKVINNEIGEDIEFKQAFDKGRVNANNELKHDIGRAAVNGYTKRLKSSQLENEKKVCILILK